MDEAQHIPYTSIELTSAPQSLCWHYGDLVDYLGLGALISMDGSLESTGFGLRYRFDTSIASQSNNFLAVWERLGTKALLLKNNQIIREINRSFYHAHVYPYPFAFFVAPDGREGIIHCPDEYNEITVEDADTGRCWYADEEGKAKDVFHAHFKVSPDGTKLISEGWCWHPYDEAVLYDMSWAGEGLTLSPPRCLSVFGDEIEEEPYAAEFLDNDHIIVAASRGQDSVLKILDWRTLSVVSSFEGQHFGKFIKVSPNFILCLYEHPFLVDIRSGMTINKWPGIRVGKQTSSILAGESLPPQVAFDEKIMRVAIANDKTVHVLDFSQIEKI